jgi:NAD(P)-dependent dehydrogenase (short-subunit alcohol dehydrogenase family)
MHGGSQIASFPAQGPRPVALLTGAVRGIGRACALALARCGFHLALNDLESEETCSLALDLAAEIAAAGAESIFVPGDVSQLDRHAVLIASVLERWGRLDCLVNNAGVPARKRGDLLDVAAENFDRCIAVNTRAVFFLSQAVARYMVSAKAADAVHRSIIDITSSNARAVSITRGEYCVSKAALSMTTRLFAARLAGEGIGVYEVRPGIIATDMTKPAKAQYDTMIGAHLVPAERWGYPEDVASTVACMAEGRLRYTVGQAVTVDGGLTMPRF